MVKLPQQNFRNQFLSYEQFRDLTMIGMAGLTDYLMNGDTLNSRRDGMVNYKLTADALGLRYESDWLVRFGNELDGYLESLVSHDAAPDGAIDVEHWVYMNSGFGRIAELLYEKYYVNKEQQETTFDEFRDIMLFELAGMAQDAVSDDGKQLDRDASIAYSLHTVANFLNLYYNDGWIEKATIDLVSNKYLDASESAEKYYVTYEGYKYAEEHLSETLGRGDGMLLSGGTGKLFFSVDASHISKLGLELVAKQETAVAELVKNGYDADATQVDLIFDTADPAHTSLEIFDNGMGMSMEQLEDGFMRLSTPYKVAQPLSEKYRRQKAGRKGIGRFAAQRLGRRLTLETVTPGAAFGLKLEIDWEQFVAERNLSAVPNTVTRIQKADCRISRVG